MRRGQGRQSGQPTRAAAPARKRKPIQTDKYKRSRAQREGAVFDFILNYTVEHMGHTPTMRETAIATDIPAISMVRKIVQALVTQNKLRYLDGLLVIPGSRFTWHEHHDAGPEISEPSVPASHWTVEYDTDGGVRVHDPGGDRPLVSGSYPPRRLVQGT